ncbi:hypothetical protein [Blastopirellula marina]|uniref:hypothetical protein n=1 Tax=Blastopirellula marina TaxID=124 RepID=UPI0011B03CBA|nr:hypothetical protein [Blastopirellula marina]
MRFSPACLSFHRLVCLGWLLLAWGLVGAKIAQAETGGIQYLPSPPNKPDHGLNLKVDGHWIDGSGYRPVRVTVGTANGKPAPADRRVSVTLQASPYYYQTSPPSVTKEIELPQGSVSGTATILVPQHNAWFGASIVTREDGRLLKELCAYQTIFYNNTNTATEAYPAAIVFHRNAPTRNNRISWALDQSNKLDSGKAVEEFPDFRILFNEQSVPTDIQLKSELAGSPYRAISCLNNLSRTDLLPLDQVPGNWLALSNADLLVFELEDLVSVQATSPEKFDAVKQWTIAGGNLLIYNGGEEGETTVNELFGFQPVPEAQDWQHSKTDNVPLAALGLINDLRNPNRGQYVSNNGVAYTNLVIQDGKLTEVGKPFGALPAAPGTPLTLASREVGFGKIVLIQEDPFPGDSYQWSRVFATFGGQRLAWFQRHGMSRMRDNLGFWDYLIPGVGVAPVTTFEFLITLFVIIIGPVNYFVLRAMGRLNLLIVTVPIGAFAVTAMLMVYAIASDGLSTQSRIRSVTVLDQQTGQGATWSRQAYYAGLASSAGLKFPTDAAVIEYEQFPTSGGADNKQIRWGEDQTLRGGYFQSRVTQQFLAMRPYQTEHQLEVTSQDGKVSVTNQLGTKILALVLVDENGKPWGATDIAAGGQSTLQADVTPTITKLRALLSEANLALPEGFDRHAYANQVSQRQTYYYRGNLPEEYVGKPDFAQSQSEQRLRRSQAMGFQSLGPRSYFAVVERFPETPIGIEVPTGKKSLEVVQATW